MNMTPITVSTIINAPIETVWKFWNEPEHITKWAFASADWEAPYAENDLKVGGNFKTTMAAKDRSATFDFKGVYTNVIPKERIEYTLEDGRKVIIQYEQVEGGVKVTETFDPENQNTPELQQEGWQNILNNFKKHVEGN